MRGALRPLAAFLVVMLLASCGVSGVPGGPARHVGTWIYEPDKEWHGGFSGIDMADGTNFAMISDRGYLVRGEFARENGRIAGFDRFRVHGYRPPGQKRPQDHDAEGLVWEDGTFWISRERIHEVWRLAEPVAVPEVLPRHPDFVTMRYNGSLEALARTPSGDLLTMNEIPRRGAYQLYRFSGGTWSRVADIPAPDGYRAVGADVGPDGWLYLLERRHTLPLRFSSRVRRLKLDGDEIVEDETLLVTPTGRYDNHEGIAIWEEEGADLRLTMVSDDNFLSMQRIEFVEYRVAPGS